MRSLGQFLQSKPSKALSRAESIAIPDAKTIFFLFERMVREYYGRRGSQAIHPMRYEGGVLFIRVASPLWANELLMHAENLCERLNQEMEEDVLSEIRVLHGRHGDEGFGSSPSSSS